MSLGIIRRSQGEYHYLIYGAANIGMAVAQELRAHGEEVCFAEPDQRLAKFARREGFRVVEGRVLTECFGDVEARNVKALLALGSEDDENYQAASSALGLGIGNVVALVNEPTRVNAFTDLGAQAFAPSMLRPKLLTTMARNPSILQLLTSTTDDRDIREFELFNPGLAGKQIGKVVLPGDTMVLTINRNGDVLAPHATTTLEIGDRLTVLGNLESLEEVRKLVRKRY